MSTEFESIAQGPEVSFAVKQLQPPSNLYVSREDHFFVDSWNSGSGVVFEVRGRMLLPSGRVVPFVYQHTPFSNRVQNRTTHPIPEGFLLNATVVLLLGSALRGQCFVRVGIGRGEGQTTTDHAVLIQNYLANAFSLTWPGDKLVNCLEGPGAILSLAGTQPGAGAEIGQFIPTGARWRPISMAFSLTASATVANRDVRILAADAVNATLWGAGGNLQQTAGQALSYYGGAWGFFGLSDASNQDNIPFPADARLAAGWRLKTSTFNLQAGDQFSAPQFLVEEWIEI